MKTAIYARYSTDMQSEASIEDQIRICQKRIDAENWTLVETYSDAALSGTSEDRPEYQRLMADIEAGRFDIILAESLDRFSRDQEHMAKLYKWTTHHQVKIVTLADGEINEMHVGLKGLMSALYIKDLAAKTRRGLEGRVLLGRSAGGLCYGYDVIKELDDDGEPDRGKREINPEQAEIVRKVFQWFMDGHGYRAIASKLNAMSIPSPRGKTWAASAIRPMLSNEMYIGRMVWNKRRFTKHPITGKFTSRLNDETEWIVKDVPKLRIIDDDLWDRVQARRAEMIETHKARQKDRWYNKKTKQWHGGENTRPGKAPSYLFSGIVTCAECGGRYIKANKTHYRCSTFINRGEKACANKISVRKDVMEKKLLHAIKEQLFDGANFENFKKEARRILTERLKARNKNAGKLQRGLATVEQQIENMIGFVKSGTITPTLSEELRKAEAEKARLTEALNADIPQIENVEAILNDALDRFWGMALDLEDFAARDVSAARATIKALVGGNIILRPTPAGGLVADMRGDYGGLIQLVKESPGKKARARSKFEMVAGARSHLYRTRITTRKKAGP